MYIWWIFWSMCPKRQPDETTTDHRQSRILQGYSIGKKVTRNLKGKQIYVNALPQEQQKVHYPITKTEGEKKSKTVLVCDKLYMYIKTTSRWRITCHKNDETLH
jgi:hypothetical protein